MHPTTEQECLAFGLYIVAVKLSCTSEARVTQWRILVQVAELGREYSNHLACDVTIRVKSKQLAYRPIFGLCRLQNIDLVVETYA